MNDKKRGLYKKFNVTRVDGSTGPGGKHELCFHFVLDAFCDPFAIPALLAYAEACKTEYPDLAADIRTLVIANCEHEWTDTLEGPDTVGEHCVTCGVDRDDGDFDHE